MPASVGGRMTAPGSNKAPPKKEDFDPYNVSRLGWEPFNVVNNAYPGVPKKKVEAPREPVKNFNFQIDPKYLDLQMYHQGQLNWLNDQALAHVMKEEQAREFVDTSCGDLKSSIDELERWLKKIDQEGWSIRGQNNMERNEWKSRFENQQEHNNITGLEILRLTDTIENVRSQIANNEPPLKKFDELSDARWKKMLSQQEKTYAKLAEELQETEWRLEQEAKAYFKVNRVRNDYNQELNVLNHYEAKELHQVSNESNKKQESWREKRANPPKRREILEEFGRPRPKLSDESDFDARSIASTRFTRSRGRFTARDSGLGSASRSTTRRYDSDGYSDRGDSLERSSVGGNSSANRIVGNRVAIGRKAEDPVDALFASSQTGLPAGYGYPQKSRGPPEMRGKKDSLEGISRANTRKSALKTDRSSISRFSERNKVSFADSRKTSPGFDVQSMKSNRQLPPLDPPTGGRKSTTSSMMGGAKTNRSSQQGGRFPPNNNGVSLNPNQQNEINKLLQKPTKWRDH